jgi:spore germination cell wall hydrolase CwlJ-like protein
MESVKFGDKIFQICFMTAAKIVSGEISDITFGANHYYSKYMKKPPYWAIGHQPVAHIGSHIFLRL